MGSERLGLVLALAAYVVVIWAASRLPFGPDARWRSHVRSLGRPARRLRDRVRRRSQVATPTGRPLERIAADARRLAPRAQHPPRGTSRAKIVAVLYAYDHVLAEACAALRIEHLLGVLEPGEELDAERTRVEGLLWLAGLRIDDAAA